MQERVNVEELGDIEKCSWSLDQLQGFDGTQGGICQK